MSAMTNLKQSKPPQQINVEALARAIARFPWPLIRLREGYSSAELAVEYIPKIIFEYQLIMLKEI